MSTATASGGGGRSPRSTAAEGHDGSRWSRSATAATASGGGGRRPRSTVAEGRDRPRGRRPWVSGDGGRRPRSTAVEDPKRTRSGREAAVAKDDAERSVRCFSALRIFGKQPEFDAPRRRNQWRRRPKAEGRCRWRPTARAAAQQPSRRRVIGWCFSAPRIRKQGGRGRDCGRAPRRAVVGK